MDLGVLGQAVGMFAVTNVDDIVILAVFFGQAAGNSTAKVVIGQYLGFAAILAISVAGALGAGLLPPVVLPYLGLLPLLLGVRAAWQAWRGPDDDEQSASGGPTALAVAAVTFANGGDNVGVYVPVFANAGTAALIVFVVVFLVLVGVWCALGKFFATRPVVARALARWGHVLLPVVLIGIGVLILVEGGL
ncbi:cadmium resistance transporter [Allokutzneria multivorans]|uniref:cadmium resistance transporter n=1 Tax=Allokutzneria multivorans TaxID=1142134 RepID=UPI0031E683B5